MCSFAFCEILYQKRIALSYLDIEKLSYRYAGNKEPVLEAFHLQLQHGETLAVVGESGSGKSTLLRLIAGLEKPSEGSISLNEELLSEAGYFQPASKRKIGMVFQDFALFPHLTVRQNIAFGLPKNNPEKVDALIEEMQLFKLGDKYPYQLSGGEQQRVALARALILEPKLLLLDEPFSNLDTMIRQSVRDFVKKVIKEKGISTILVTHDLEDARQVADRIVVLRKGKLQQSGSWEEILEQPATPYVKALFGPIIDQK